MVVVGVGLYLLNRFGAPYIDGKILTIINIFVVVVVLFWLAQELGLIGSLRNIRIR